MEKILQSFVKKLEKRKNPLFYLFSKGA